MTKAHPNSNDSRHMFEESTALSGLKRVKLESRVCIKQDLSGAGLGGMQI